MKAELIKTDGSVMEVMPFGGKKSFSLKELQEIVGGSIDIQRLPKSKKKLVLNESGKLIGLPVNKVASKLWRENYPITEYPFNNDGTIVGDVIVCDSRMFR